MAHLSTQALRSTMPFLAGVATVLTAVLALAQAPSTPAQNAPGVPPSAHSNETSDAVNQAGGTIVSPKVFFTEPKDGATVAESFMVKFGVSGMKVLPAGQLVPGSGHHHLIVDGTPTKKGEVVGMDATHMHFGKGQTESTIKLSPGKHTLTLQFADGAHRSYGETMSSTITVTVK